MTYTHVYTLYDKFIKTVLYIENICCVAFEAWESYETNRNQLQDFLRRADIEASRTAPPGGQETIQKELMAKQELMVALNDLQPEVEKLGMIGATLKVQLEISYYLVYNVYTY
jgi:hypothetical protein